MDVHADQLVGMFVQQSIKTGASAKLAETIPERLGQPVKREVRGTPLMVKLDERTNFRVVNLG